MANIYVWPAFMCKQQTQTPSVILTLPDILKN